LLKERFFVILNLNPDSNSYLPFLICLYPYCFNFQLWSLCLLFKSPAPLCVQQPNDSSEASFLQWRTAVLEVIPAHFVCFSCKLNFLNIAREKRLFLHVSMRGKLMASRKGSHEFLVLSLCCYFCECQQVVLKCSAVVGRKSHTK